MRFPELEDALSHVKEITGDLGRQTTDDEGNTVMQIPTKLSAYNYMIAEDAEQKGGEENTVKLEYVDTWKIKMEGTHVETYTKDKAGRNWIKAII